MVALGVPLGLLLSGLAVWHASSAAFTAATGNATNSWTSGTVTITDDDGGSAMFDVSGLAPGSTG